MTDAPVSGQTMPDGAAGFHAREASDFGLIAWLAKAHGQPYSASALRASLPVGLDMAQPNNIARALEIVGLNARLVTIRLKTIDPAVLPCVLFAKDGTLAVLVAISVDRKTFTVIDPASDSLEIEIRKRALAQKFFDRVLLVAPLAKVAESRLSPDAGRSSAERHWFWGPVQGSLSVWAQIFVAAFCINLMSLALPIFVMNVYDRVIPNAAFVTLGTLAAGVVLALMLDLALRNLRSSVLEKLARRVDLQVAARLFDQTLHVRLMSRTGGAAGMANAIRDFETTRDFFGSASFVAFIDLLFIGFFIALLFFIVGPLAWVPLIAVPIVLMLAIIAQIPLGRSAATAQRLATKRHVVLVESLLGIEAIKSLNAEPVMQREWENAVAASSRISGRTKFWSGLATSGTQFVQQGVSVVIIVWGVFLVSEQAITIGALIAANLLAGRVLAPLAAVSQTIFRAHYAMKSMSVLNDLMKLPRERAGTVRSDLKVERGDLSLRDIGFRYPGAEQPALTQLTFDIGAGEIVALLGRVGSGKSTTGMLLNGLLVADTGNILIDGHGIAQYDPADLRDGVGYLTQESELFTGTLRENMVIGRPSATEEEVRRALYIAGMDEFVATHAEGLNLFIGEKGSRLSGGQRQGLALARLLIREPKVMFLDEPTNSMDNQMESTVIQRIRSVGQGRTTLIFCTHRMSLADVADRFIVLDKGRKVLDGPKNEVLAKLRAVQSQKLEG